MNRLRHLLTRLAASWPGVKGRRAINSRLARIEGRTLELQIQLAQRLERLEMRLAAESVKAAGKHASASDEFRAALLARADDQSALLRRIEEHGLADAKRLQADMNDQAALLRRIEERGLADAKRLKADMNDQAALLRRIEEHGLTAVERLQAGMGEHMVRIEAERAAAAAAELNEAEIWLRDRVSGHRLRVFRGPEGQVLANPKAGVGRPIAVISIPKAGTYLIGLLLQRLGFQDSELHVSQPFLTDYRGQSINEKRGPGYGDHTYHLPVGASALLIGGGQFVVGHLQADPAARQALAGFNKIFLYRDLVDATLSHLRFMVDSGRAPPEAAWAALEPSPEQALGFLADLGPLLFTECYAPLIDWLSASDVFAISFEELMGDRGIEHRATRLRALGEFLGIDDDVEGTFAKQVVGWPTKTLSDGRTQAGPYHSEAVLQAFRDLGINALHARLGYPPI